ncbi:MAG: sulfide/dihydroorotate dehydrogenase-like FAD/NAD-binding protein [Planctomycetota bacterium]
MFKILSKEQLSPDVFRMDIEAPLIAKKRKPGQFIILRVDEAGERIPLTIADADAEKGTITLIFQTVGTSTLKLSRLNKDESLLNFIGPLGKPTHIEKFNGSVVGIGGGIGIAPLHPIAQGMKSAGNKVINIIGARSKNLLIMEEEMQNISDELIITTDDGSYGKKGFVTDALREIIQRGEKIDLVVAIGPAIMMMMVCKLTKEFGIKTLVSLNSIMVDGTGMCGACRVVVGGKTKFACVHGPEFDGHEIDFDLLVKRQKTYLKEEKESKDKYLASIK